MNAEVRSTKFHNERTTPKLRCNSVTRLTELINGVRKKREGKIDGVFGVGTDLYILF